MTHDLFSPGEPQKPKPAGEKQRPRAVAVKLYRIERAQGMHSIIAQHEDGQVSLISMSDTQLATLKELAGDDAEHHLPDADLTFDAEYAARIARAVLSGNRELVAGVNGAARILAAMVILQGMK